MGKRNDHGHILLARPDLVLRRNETGKRTTKEVPAIRVAFVECNIRGSNPQSHGGYQADCLGALIKISARNGIAEETVRKITGLMD